ncbi:MAG: N-acylglucosamine 2-epimerase, partial [Tannerellaceae bacterium]|nr:N-acylglucosamine 2-epimerase [Tannerellaceae bacterium]
MKHFVIALLISIILHSMAYAQAENNQIAEQLRSEIVKDLTTNILSFWAKHSPDPSGGFYGMITPAAIPVPDANKGGILNARILWTFSTAYRMLGDEQYKDLADKAARYFLD